MPARRLTLLALVAALSGPIAPSLAKDAPAPAGARSQPDAVGARASRAAATASFQARMGRLDSLMGAPSGLLSSSAHAGPDLGHGRRARSASAEN